MTKLTLNDIANLSNENSVVNSINNNNASLEAALENTLSRDGTSPNYMQATLDMNGNRIVNLPAPTSVTEPVRYAEFQSIVQAASDYLRLPSDTTFYVSPSGDDNNDGLTVGEAWLTLQYAFDQMAKIDANGYSVTIQIADGTYALAQDESLYIYHRPINCVSFVIQGNTTTPDNVYITHTWSSDWSPRIINVYADLDEFKGFKIAQVTSSYANTYCICALEGASILGLDKIKFGANNGYLLAVDAESFISMSDSAAFTVYGNNKLIVELWGPKCSCLLNGTWTISTAVSFTYLCRVYGGGFLVKGGGFNIVNAGNLTVTSYRYVCTSEASVDETFLTNSSFSGVGGSTPPDDRRGRFYKPSNNVNLYVRPSDGNDANDGFTNTVGGAFKTPEAAYAWVVNHLQGRNNANSTQYVVYIHVDTGTISNEQTLFGTASASVQILNSVSTVYDANSVSPSVSFFECGDLYFEKGTIKNSSTGNAVQVYERCNVEFYQVNLGATGGDHYNISYGSKALVHGNYTITGNFGRHIYCVGGTCYNDRAATVTVSGTPAIAQEFVRSEGAGVVYVANTYSGSATGKRYTALYGGGIEVYGGGASYLPGNSSGTVSATSYSWYE